MSAVLNMPKEEYTESNMEISLLKGKVPAYNEVVKFNDADGNLIATFRCLVIMGKKMHGVFRVNTKAVRDGFLVAYSEKDGNRFQRGQKNTRCYKGLKKRYSGFFKDKCPSLLPEGTLLLAIPPGKTIFDTNVIFIIDGGHRCRAAAEAAKAKKVESWFPTIATICSEHTIPELAQIFVDANTYTPMSQADLISAAVVSETLLPIYNRFKDAEKRGITGKYRVVHHLEEHNADKENTLLFSVLFADMMYGLAQLSSTADMVEMGNEPSQYCVDAWLKVYVLFCEIVGRKGVETSRKAENAKLDNKVFACNLARMALVMPIGDHKKPVYKSKTKLCVGLSSQHWRNFIKTLTLNEGTGYQTREELKKVGSAGGSGKTAMWSIILKKKLDVEGNGSCLVTPDSNFPRYSSSIMLHDGEKSILWPKS